MKSVSRKITSLAMLAWLILLVPVTVNADPLEITSEQWARIKTTGDFMAIPGLKELVAELDTKENYTCDIHYAGGESGQFWAQQFRNRLIALGLESERIQLVQGVSAVGRLELTVRESR